MMATVEAWAMSDVLSGSVLLATVGVVIYFLYTQLRDDVTWEKYGVKEGSMGITDFRAGCTKLMEQYGDTVGIKRSKLQLITRDLEILKIVMVKDFSNFVNRFQFLNSNSLMKKGVFFLEGDDWRRVRHVLSPSFSSGKLKHISKTIDETALKLAQVLEDCAREDKLVEIKHSTGQYTSEIIAKTAFGLQTACLGGEDDQFTGFCKKLFKSRNKVMSKVMLVFFRFPWIHKLLVQNLKISFFDSVSSDSDYYLTTVLRRSIADREKYEREGGRKPADLLQSMVSAKAAGDKAEANTVNGTDNSKTDALDKLPKTMTQDELIGQSILIIFAGFETTATTLQMCLYMLAKHPDIQEKVYEEIQRVVSGDCPTNEELQELNYMEQVINETLRLYPPAGIISRVAAETRTYGDITIPKGATVMIPIFHILKHPKHFPDPERFDPDRFTEENKAKRDPMAFMPFGYGPRLCLGMRLAYLELKIALVHVLKKVTFELNHRTVPKIGQELTLKIQPLLATEDPIMLCVRLRNL